MRKRKVVARIKGGLGNQLFCYAAARRLALVNNCELVIDNISGFARDRQYRRRYMLDRFNISARFATPWERLVPFERLRRAMLKWQSRKIPFAHRRYVEQEKREFDERLLALSNRGVLYLDGYWQSDGYFTDAEQTIRDDLRFNSPTDDENQRMAAKISSSQAVAIHVRWFETADGNGSGNVSANYYDRATTLIESRIDSPHYFVFSDDPGAAESLISRHAPRITIVSHNQGDDNAHADLWLMSQCRHFIIANSTFSWWGAWLSMNSDKIVVTPDTGSSDRSAWGFQGLIPDEWLIL